MSNLKLNIPNDVIKIHKAFKKNGKKLYVVGGAIRDAILGKSPKDFDLATDAKPEEVEKIAKAYDLPYVKINNTAELRKKLTDVITASGPVVCEVMCPENQEIIPMVSAIKNDDGSMTSKPIEDMYPFLDRDEFLKEMIVDSYLK